jgi:hypothetical protein
MSKPSEIQPNLDEFLANYIEISRQFLRSIRLDKDFQREDALTGYICQGTAKSVLENMAKQIVGTKQRAFTWTGPYGGGKSSLALVLCSLVSSNEIIRNSARQLINFQSDSEIGQAFNSTLQDWLVLPIVGSRESVISAIDNALNDTQLEEATIKKPGRPKLAKSTQVIERLVEEANQRIGSGVLLVIDELGKFLEAAAQTGDDIYFYQELAEAASRCNGKLIIVGILHQSFEQYATRLGREARNEWAKVQGRFIDIPLVAGTDEVIELVSRALKHKKKYVHESSRVIVKSVADAIRRRRPGAPQNIEEGLNRCWPLHPITAALLGPISKRRFGQNERSTFGFLSSREPIGFSEFLESTSFSPTEFYGADRYWDYLKANMEPSILASPDGHRWSVGVDAVERTESKDNALQLNLVKTIALIEMFKNGSGLAAETDVLLHSIKGVNSEDIQKALSELQTRSIIIFRKHLNAWGIYSGSDFDVEAAVLKAYSEVESANLSRVSELSDLYPVIAKRLYSDTGTMRWFSRAIIFSSDLEKRIHEFRPQTGCSGEFLLVLPSRDSSKHKLDNLIKESVLNEFSDSLIIGLPTNSDRIAELGTELGALEQVKFSRPELDGDNVAMREIDARISFVRTELEEQLKDAFNLAQWYWKSDKLKIDAKRGLSNISSYIAEQIYPSTPYISSELINRDQISSNAKSALRDLLHRMIDFETLENLGYEGYPADAGLYYTVLKSTDLHRKVKDIWRFQAPSDDSKSRSFKKFWQATTDFMGQKDKTTRLDELYEFWSRVPFGIKKGVMPILTLAFYLANKQHLAMYIEGTFIPELDSRYLDEWLQDERRIAFRYVEIEGDRKELLEGLAKELSQKLAQPVSPEPLDSARGLVTIVKRLPMWTHKTSSLSPKAIKTRNMLLNARDPHKVLFNDLPAQYSEASGEELVKFVVKLIEEMSFAYPKMLSTVKAALLKALDHDDNLSELRKRVEGVKGIAGEFLLEAFANRVGLFDGSDSAIEGLISLAVNKTATECNDTDIDAAILKLCEWAMEFRKVEAMSFVRGRPSSRHAIAVIFGTGQGQSVTNTFDVADSDLPAINNLVEKFLNSFNGDIKREVFLAALAEAGARMVKPKTEKSK